MKFITIFYTITTVLFSISVNLSAAAMVCDSSAAESSCDSSAAESSCDSPDTQTASVFRLVGSGSCVASPEAEGAEAREAAQAAAVRVLFKEEPLPISPDAEKGPAAFKAGMAYWKGDGVPVDYLSAMEYFKRSSHYGFLDANVALSECYLMGFGSISPAEDKSQNRAYKLLVDVVFKGSPRGTAYQRAKVLLKERFGLTMTGKSA